MDLSDDLNNVSETTDLNTLINISKSYSSDVTVFTNGPSSITGAAKLEVNSISTGFVVQELKLLKASGGIYTRVQSASVWSAWVKIA